MTHVPAQPVVTTVVTGFIQTNTYLIYDPASLDAMLVDPGGDAHLIRKTQTTVGCVIRLIALTHGHGDHIGALASLKKHYGVPVAIHRADSQMLISAEKNLSGQFGMPITTHPADILLEDTSVCAVGRFQFQVLHTPGHTPGSVCFYTAGILISGDTLFAGSVGRYDLPGSSGAALARSLSALMRLPDETVVYPGHGPATMIRTERADNTLLWELTHTNAN